MRDDALPLEAALAETALADREISTIDLSWWDEVVYALRLEPGEGPVAWPVARRVLEQTGRWPLVTDSSPRGGASDPRHPGPYPFGDFSCLDDEQVHTRAHAAVEELEAAQRTAFGAMDLPGLMAWHLSYTTQRVGVAPSPEEVLAALPGQVSEKVAERWFLDWEVASGHPPAPVSRRYLRWPGDGALLMFCPTISGAETLAPFPFWADGDVPGASTERLIALVEDWSRRYGAELMSNLGTLLYFTVARPPQTIDDAFELAAEQMLISPDLQYPIREHARALVGHDAWLLHCRP